MGNWGCGFGALLERNLGILVQERLATIHLSIQYHPDVEHGEMQKVTMAVLSATESRQHTCGSSRPVESNISFLSVSQTWDRLNDISSTVSMSRPFRKVHLGLHAAWGDGPEGPEWQEARLRVKSQMSHEVCCTCQFPCIHAFFSTRKVRSHVAIRGSRQTHADAGATALDLDVPSHFRTCSTNPQFSWANSPPQPASRPFASASLSVSVSVSVHLSDVVLCSLAAMIVHMARIHTCMGYTYTTNMHIGHYMSVYTHTVIYEHATMLFSGFILAEVCGFWLPVS